MNKTELAVMEWLQGRDTGLSSKTIAYHMIGVPERRPSYPLDPSDLGRCLRLLEKFPKWRARLPELATLSKEWALLISRWEDLESSMLNEVGLNWDKAQSAPKTYHLMKDILKGQS